ncbi:hypothetical protein CRENBAI_021304 [Crenichthys baileyi]|uniref:Uncharacterized protein n=1 Tax=Crenichthys baileyi TaxID=28760 RepID=A0AAV9RII6_9TELE
MTYKAELKYFYSYAYLLEYLINSTQLDVSASSTAIKDNRSFIGTLSTGFFSDATYTQLMVIPQLKTFKMVIENADCQTAHFKFFALHFIEQHNETVSTKCLHCYTHLCEMSTCETLKRSNRKKRSTLTHL